MGRNSLHKRQHLKCWSRESSKRICSSGSWLDRHRLRSQLSLPLLGKLPSSLLKGEHICCFVRPALKYSCHIALMKPLKRQSEQLVPTRWRDGSRDRTPSGLRFGFIYCSEQPDSRSDSERCWIMWWAENIRLLNGYYSHTGAEHLCWLRGCAVNSKKQ